MFLFSRISCASALALFFVTTVASADELPVGAWKLHVGGEEPSALVITEVKSDGKVIGEAFGKRIEGKWDGTRLSFKTGTGADKPKASVQMWRSFEGWMVKEKQGENVRYSLTGNFKIEAYCFKIDVCRGWYAHYDLVEAKKLEGTWVVESTSRDKELAMPWKGGQFVFDKDKVTVTLPKSKEQTFPITVDSAKGPKTMDFAPPKNQAPWLMIYELDGDSLKLCIEHEKRPTEFNNKQGLVVVLKRKK